MNEQQTWKLVIRYDGARYRGWQRLGQSDEGETIQAKVEGVISSLCGTETLVTGSGRTDAGVHALAQTAHFRTAEMLEADTVVRHANRYLPDDIAVISAEPADPRFHARYGVVEKHYLYRLDIGLWPEPFERKYCWHLGRRPDWPAMEKAAQMLIGEHDFSAFTSMKSKKKSAVREILGIEFFPPVGDESIARIRLRAKGFLHNMARIIVGTLVEVGLGERKASSLAALLNEGKRSESGRKAPAKGLFLEKALYR